MAKAFGKMRMGMKRLLWDLRGRYNRYKAQITKDFNPKSHVKLVQTFKQKNAMPWFEV